MTVFMFVGIEKIFKFLFAAKSLPQGNF